MTDDLTQFERQARQRLEEFLDPSLKKARPNVRISRPQEGLTVTLAVRKHGDILDERFIHPTETISRCQAKLEAEKAAREAGWPIVAFVVDYT